MSAPSAQPAIDRWKSDLAAWAIPEAILDSAPDDPWGLSPRPFAARADRAVQATTPTPSLRRATDALPLRGAVLDVGSGAGAASLPLLARASRLVAVDTSADMLEELRARVPAGIDLTLVHGRWPDSAAEVPQVDVVVCHHAAYNIANLDEAVLRMTEKARCRVVLELTSHHPLSTLNFLWPILHGIQRPTRPTAGEAVDVIRACGLSAHFEEWEPVDLRLSCDHVAELVASVRRHLCLGADRDPEIAQALESRIVRRGDRVGLAPSPVVTVWWDPPSAGNPASRAAESGDVEVFQ
jgi:SAM-dependent methyltransferase